MEIVSVDHHGQETAYRHRGVGGEGPTLLCVHGSGGAHGVWRGQFCLANDYPVAALDLSGHGDSGDMDADAGYETLSAYVDDVAAVAEETDASVLIGNSFGGAVALTLVPERDLDPDALVLAGTGAKLVVLSGLLGWLENDLGRVVSLLHGEDKLFYIDDERPVEDSKEAMYDTEQTATSRDFLPRYMFDVHGEVSEISVPTLVLVGEYDRLTPPSYHEYLAETTPDGELGTVEDAAHLAMLERPAAFNEAVESFPDRHMA